MKVYFLATVFALCLTVVCGKFAVPFLRRIKCGQPILKYVETHKEKSGTPTMGGLFLILPSCVIFFVFGGYKSNLAVVAVAIGIAFLAVGFLDDFIKIKSKDNQGLKAYQKIIFQALIAVFAGIFSYKNGITEFYLPFTNYSLDLGLLSPFLIGIIFIAITNSVNLTDGLDGLAGSVCAPYLCFIFLIICFQKNLFTEFDGVITEYEGIALLSISLFGGVLGYMVFNVNKASVFMGDTGSLSLGGFIGGISIFSGNSFYIPIIGIMFAVSSISVIVQVIYYKKTKKRVFLMAPVHHHFQLKGNSEAKIAYVYFLITFVLGALSVLSYL